MVDMIGLVNPGYQKSVDAAGKPYKAAEAAKVDETAAEVTQAAAQESAAKPAEEDTYVPEDKEAVKAADEVKTYKQNTKLVEQLKAEQAQIQSRFLNTVKDMLGKQGKKVADGDGIWKVLASGDFEVDAETKQAAQAAIAEDGYWGVKQTSERMVEFAKALVGGDPSKIALMRDAFEKGYAAAEKTWGGALPQLSQDTRKATLELFDKWEKEAKGETSEKTDAPDASGKTEENKE